MYSTVSLGGQISIDMYSFRDFIMDCTYYLQI